MFAKSLCSPAFLLKFVDGTSVKKTDVYDIPQKSRPLDSLSVSAGKYTNPSAKLHPKNRASVTAPQSKVLKCKRSSSLDNGVSSEFRKRSGKDVSLNSFVKSNGKGKLKAAVAGFKANGRASDVCKQEKRSLANVSVRSLRNVSGFSQRLAMILFCLLERMKINQLVLLVYTDQIVWKVASLSQSGLVGFCVVKKNSAVC